MEYIVSQISLIDNLKSPISLALISPFEFQTKAHLDILAEALLRWARGR